MRSTRVSSDGPSALMDCLDAVLIHGHQLHRNGGPLSVASPAWRTRPSLSEHCDFCLVSGRASTGREQVKQWRNSSPKRARNGSSNFRQRIKHRRRGGSHSDSLDCPEAGMTVTFAFSGMLGFLWLGLWLAVYPRPSVNIKNQWGETHKHRFKDTWSGILRRRETWAIVIGRSLTDPIWWFYVFWLPQYLSDPPGFWLKQIAAFANAEHRYCVPGSGFVL
jgi:hypothetical protein